MTPKNNEPFNPIANANEDMKILKGLALTNSLDSLSKPERQVLIRKLRAIQGLANGIREQIEQLWGDEDTPPQR